MIDIFAHAERSTFELDPFPHLIIDDALEPDVYARFAATYPSLDVINRRDAGTKNNRLYLLSARDVDRCAAITDEWKAFVRFHVSAAFWQRAVPLLRPHLLAINPRLQELAGRSLDDFRITVREHDAVFDEEISLDCQFGANSPVTRASSVRSPHLDRPSKLFNALLYCRADDDDTPGGELILFRTTGPVRYTRGSSVLQSDIAPAKRIAYRANRLVLFFNSPRSVHAVAPRPRTPHVRRYVNFLCQFRHDLFTVERAPPLTRLVGGALASLRTRALPRSTRGT